MKPHYLGIRDNSDKVLYFIFAYYDLDGHIACISDRYLPRVSQAYMTVDTFRPHVDHQGPF
jgi:hypothetical protein